MASLKQYEGRLRLDLSRKGQVYKRVEQKNTVATLVQDTFLDGNFSYLLEREKAIVEDWFDGCLLTDKANNPSLCMIAHDSDVTAQAGNDTYTGLNPKRGSYIPVDSHIFTDPTLGFMKVWKWDNAYGNGKINSVCLCPHETAIFDYQEGGLPIDGNPPNKPLGYSYIGNAASMYANNFDSSISHLSVIDYNTGKGYYITLSSARTSLYIDEFEVSCSRVRIIGDTDHVVRKIARHTIPISPALPAPSGFGDFRNTFAYTGDAIHILTFDNFTEGGVEKVRIKDYKVLLSDLTAFVEATPTPMVYSDVWLYPFPSSSDINSEYQLFKDGFVYNDTDRYLYCLGKEGGENGVAKMLRFDMDSTDVTSYDLSFAPPIRSGSDNGYVNNGASILLDNGDFYKTYIAQNSLPTYYSYYFHNNKVYAVEPFQRSPNSSTWLRNISGGKGTIIQGFYNPNVLYFQLDNIYPYVSTVANLSEEIKKTADFDMTLYYSVREV